MFRQQSFFKYLKPIQLNFLFAVIILAVPYNGLSQSGTKEESASFKSAKHILQKMSNYLSAAEQFSLKATMTEDHISTNGHYIQSDITFNMVIKRPDKVYVEINSDEKGKRFWYNGKNVAMLMQPSNFYSTGEVSGNIDEMINFVYNTFGISLPLSGLAFSNPYELLMEGVTDGYYLGIHKIDGINCHHLLFIEEDAEWQVWVEDGPKMAPKKYSVTYMVDEGALDISMVIEKWKFNTYTPDEIFNFMPPVGATKIEFITVNE